MLKVFNKDPHFMRDAVIVDNYAAAWDIICSMQQRLGKSILAVGKDIKSTTEDMVAEMIDEESAIICIYYGEEVTEEDANALGAALEEKYPEVEVEIHFGGQPIYYYVISVE